jgi:hypothetical protein
LKIGRAEIGIILIACSVLPLFVPYGSWLVFSAIGQEIAHSFLSIINIVGLTLLLSDEKVFLHRTKGNRIVSALLIIIGLITFVWSLLMISMSLAIWGHDYSIEGRYPTPKEWALYLLSLAWAGLVSISGVVWFIFGYKVLNYKDQAIKELQK